MTLTSKTTDRTHYQHNTQCTQYTNQEIHQPSITYTC